MKAACQRPLGHISSPCSWSRCRPTWRPTGRRWRAPPSVGSSSTVSDLRSDSPSVGSSTRSDSVGSSTRSDPSVGSSTRSDPRSDLRPGRIPSDLRPSTLGRIFDPRRSDLRPSTLGRTFLPTLDPRSALQPPRSDLQPSIDPSDLPSVGSSNRRGRIFQPSRSDLPPSVGSSTLLGRIFNPTPSVGSSNRRRSDLPMLALPTLGRIFQCYRSDLPMLALPNRRRS